MVKVMLGHTGVIAAGAAAGDPVSLPSVGLSDERNRDSIALDMTTRSSSIEHFMRCFTAQYIAPFTASIGHKKTRQRR